MFGVAARLKAVDDGYFVFLNYVTGKFEVHNRKDFPHTLCLVLPYDRLDERAVNRVLRTRAERAAALVAEMEVNNDRLQREKMRAAVEKIENGV